MARVKGEAYKPTRKEKAAKRMKKVKKILVVITLICCVIMVINAIAGMTGKKAVVEHFGGEEKMAGLSAAELQNPYYAEANRRMDDARTPIGKVWGFFNNLWCLALLWKTCRWGWGFKSTVSFTIALSWEIIFLAIGLPLYFRWKKIAEKKEEKKPMVDVQKEMNQKLEEEQQKMEREAKVAEQKAKDEAWQEEYEAIMRQKRVAEWGNRDGGNGKR